MKKSPIIESVVEVRLKITDFRLAHIGLWAETLWGACLVRQTGLDYGGIEVHALFYGILGIALVLIAVKTAWRPAAASGAHYLWDISAALCMLVSSFLLTVPIFISGFVSAVLGCLLGGLGSARLMVRWGSFYSGLPSKEAFWYISASFVVYLALFSFINHLSGLVGFFVLSALVFISVTSLLKSFSSPVPRESAPVYYDKKTIWALWKTMLGVLVYGFVLGMRKGLSIQVNDPLVSLICHFFSVVLVFGIMLWVFSLKRSVNFSRLFQIFMLIFATGFLFYPFSDGASREFISSMFVVGVALIFMLVWLALVDICHHSSIHPSIILGAGWFLYSIARPVGALVSDSLYSTGTEQYPLVMSLVLVYGIVLCAAFLLGANPPGNRQIFADLVEPMPLPELFNRIDQRCSKLGKAAGLTAREIEVLQHLCKGRTKAYIAETLYISENTVRGHVKKAYSKLEVHNKDELLRLIGIE
jgi:DNA-binding CsgD family transcriptional regulator